jgi:hypothetical protein
MLRRRSQKGTARGKSGEKEAGLKPKRPRISGGIGAHHQRTETEKETKANGETQWSSPFSRLAPGTNETLKGEGSTGGSETGRVSGLA